MGYLAIARQWRPSQFDDLVGQEHVVQTLKNAIRLNRVSHAYLFSGARGVGKTSVARIFAKALRCPNVDPAQAIACNKCPECTAIAESRSVDVVEIDGASNNGVEAVRGIRENVVYGASSGTYKIYIIDEVHMLSLSAFNALLKTLEEPPSHVIFIFATTEVQKIPLTIVSRCQRFEFRRLTNAQIVSRLQYILAAEKFALSEEALRAIAGQSDGSLRDALSLLDQVLSYFGERNADSAPLDEQQVVESLGITNSSATRQFLEKILAKDLPAIIKLVGETYLSGIDLKYFSERCLEELRLLYLVALAEDAGNNLSANDLDISNGHFAELKEIAHLGTLVQLERMAQILAKTIQQLNWASHPRFLLEMASVRMSKLKELQRIEGGTVTHVQQETEEEVTPPPPVVREKREPISAAAPQRPEPPPPPSSMMTASARPQGNEPSQQTWKNFIDTVMKKKPLLGSLLSHANFKVTSDDKGKIIQLAFPEGSFYQRQAGENRTRSEFEELIRLFFGESTRLIISSGIDVEDASLSLEETRRIENDIAKKNALEHPMVLKMKEVLGAEVVDVNVES